MGECRKPYEILDLLAKGDLSEREAMSKLSKLFDRYKPHTVRRFVVERCSSNDWIPAKALVLFSHNPELLLEVFSQVDIVLEQRPLIVDVMKKLAEMDESDCFRFFESRHTNHAVFTAALINKTIGLNQLTESYRSFRHVDKETEELIIERFKEIFKDMKQEAIYHHLYTHRNHFALLAVLSEGYLDAWRLLDLLDLVDSLDNRNEPIVKLRPQIEAAWFDAMKRLEPVDLYRMLKDKPTYSVFKCILNNQSLPYIELAKYAKDHGLLDHEGEVSRLFENSFFGRIAKLEPNEKMSEIFAIGHWRFAAVAMPTSAIGRAPKKILFEYFQLWQPERIVKIEKWLESYARFYPLNMFGPENGAKAALNCSLESLAIKGLYLKGIAEKDLRALIIRLDKCNEITDDILSGRENFYTFNMLRVLITLVPEKEKKIKLLQLMGQGIISEIDRMATDLCPVYDADVHAALLNKVRARFVA